MLLYYNKCGGKPVEANEAGLQLILVQLGNKNQRRDAIEQLVSTSGKAQAGPAGERREGEGSMQYLLVPTVDQQVEVVRLVSGTREMSQRLLTGTLSFAK